jgi:hypothetical protein
MGRFKDIPGDVEFEVIYQSVPRCLPSLLMPVLWLRSQSIELVLNRW